MLDGISSVLGTAAQIVIAVADILFLDLLDDWARLLLLWAYADLMALCWSVQQVLVRASVLGILL